MTWILLVTYYTLAHTQLHVVRKTYQTQEACETARGKLMTFEFVNSSAQPIAICRDDGTDFQKRLDEVMGQ